MAEIVVGNETVLLLACSDGAGSAPLSQVGSNLVCKKAITLMADDIQSRERLESVTSDSALRWLSDLHEMLVFEAAMHDTHLRDLACTTLLAVIGDSGAAFAQIGDGAIVINKSGVYQTVFWPQSGEYINTTNFITDPRFPALFSFCWMDERIDELALFTDGIQMLCLDYSSKQAHGPFFYPLFERLRVQPDPHDLCDGMRAFLSSQEIVARTDDDKTLILATRLGDGHGFIL